MVQNSKPTEAHILGEKSPFHCSFPPFRQLYIGFNLSTEIVCFFKQIFIFTDYYRHTHCFVLICPFFVYIDTLASFF